MKEVIQDNAISCFFILGHKEQDQMFAIHEQGTKIAVGKLGSQSAAIRYLEHLIFRENIYLNPAKMVREYQESGFDLIATVCIRGYNYRDALEMFRAARRIKDKNVMRRYLSHKDGEHLLELLLNMEPKDEQSKKMQALAEHVMSNLENQSVQTKSAEANHAN